MMRFLFTSLLLVVANSMMAQKHYNYESVEGDPMKARIYTLDNGLKVYLTNNPDQPRIQTYIAVRAGGKNDPAESTGLAHYLEHLMFKGTSSFGTQDYAAERPLLDSIQARYEVYGHTTDALQRKAIYRSIDSLSYEASRFSIANEYDKLMAGIGSNGSNAYTDVDVTCYIEDIPSNEVDRWARVQSDRFQDMVIRGFHTELEAVYEEYNIHLTSDFDKLDNEVNKILYPHHPYGTQTVIGTQEHLKNPSLKNVLNYYREWYVPNNVAVCMSGDIQDMDSIVGIIDKHFGAWKRNEHLPVLNFQKEQPLTAPVYAEVVGREAEMIVVAWRFPGIKERDYDYLQILDKILCNGRAGLFDLDLNQSQKVLTSQTFTRGMSDYSTLWLIGMPKEGQALDDVRDLMLDEIQKVKKGDFDEKMLEAIINNLKLERMKMLESNEKRADAFVSSFINGVSWRDEVECVDRLTQITKQDLVAFANRYLTDGYACVKKLQGEDPNEKKIDKPEINPIEMNRDKQSAFVADVLGSKPHDISPVFVDFSKDVKASSLRNGNDFVYKKNMQNGLFTLTYRIDRGNKQNPALGVASSYIEYLGTRKMDAERLQSELYRMACDVSFDVNSRRTEITISGLSDNMTQAMRLVEDWINKAEPDDEAYQALVEDILKSRADNKLEQQSNYYYLVNYGIYGKDNPFTHQLSAEQLRAAKPSDFISALKDLRNVHQTITYYGPLDEDEALRLILKNHKTSSHPSPEVADNVFVAETIERPEVVIAPYDAKNIYMQSYSNNGQKFDPEHLPAITLFNEYFGGGMNTIVFQELRESRGLAYNANALYHTPEVKNSCNYFTTHIITQNDKMSDCIDVFNNITEEMPLSDGAFALAKDAILKRLATERPVGGKVIDYYLAQRDLGYDHDSGSDIYDAISKMTLKDLSDFHRSNVKGRTYRFLILGDEKELDMDKLRSLGPIRRVSTEEIFGY